MRCSDLMKLDVERCLDIALVVEAAAAMRDRNVGFLPVVADTGAVVGALTDRDIVLRVLAAGSSAERTVVADVMTYDAVTCGPDDELAIAEDAMMRFQKARIVCVDKRRKVLGVISLSDIAEIEPSGRAGRVAAAIAVREAAVLSRVRSIGELRCSDVMKHGVERTTLDTSLAAVARLMRDRNIGFVPVCNDEGAAIGVVTDRDIVVRAVASLPSPEATRVSSILTRDVVACSPDDPLRAAEDLMAQTQKSRILCVDGRRRPVGVISLSDLARVEGVNTVTRVLRAVSSRPVTRLSRAVNG